MKIVEMRLDPEAADILRALLLSLLEKYPIKGLDLPGDNWKNKAPVNSWNGGVSLHGKDAELILLDSGELQLLKGG